MRTYGYETVVFTGKTGVSKKVFTVKEKYLTTGDLFSRIVNVIVK